MDEQHQQHQSPQDVILDGDVGEIGVGHDGDDVEDEQQAGGKARAQSERKQTGSDSSVAVPSTAATCGDSAGTWYSFSNKASVTLQSRILVSPDRRNTRAT